MGPSQPLAPSDLACGTQAPRPIHCLRSEWQRPEVGLFCTRHAALQACKPAPSPCRSPQLALPGLARGWSVAQATGRGTGPSSNSRSTPKSSNLRSPPKHQTAQTCPSSRLHRASPASLRAACCVLRRCVTTPEFPRPRTRRPLGLVLMPILRRLCASLPQQLDVATAHAPGPTLNLAPCSNHRQHPVSRRPSSQHPTIALSSHRIIRINCFLVCLPAVGNAKAKAFV